MKLLKICAVGAFLCGSSFCHAQIQFLDGLGQPKSLLVSTDETNLQPAAAAGVVRESPLAEVEMTSDGINNPFSYTDLSPSDQAESAKQPAVSSDPTSLPVGIHHRGRNVIDQILQQGVISEIPNAAFAPVMWPVYSAQQPYNPTAQVLLYNRCANSLWDNYAAEQAAACARMYAHLAHSKHAGCAHCTSGCAHCTSGSCATGNCQPAVRSNRYTRGAVGCDTHTVAAVEQGALDQGAYPQVQPVQSPQIPMSTPAPAPTFVPAPLEVPVVTQPRNAALQSPVDNVARLPTVTR